jgi:nicotinate-nucleotide adenylyltransferase
MQQLAIFGGTFDPIHCGHLFIAATALNQIAALQKIIWLPSGSPPHKRATAFKHRLAMLELATQNNPAFTISMIDRVNVGASYAINTLINLSTSYPNTYWYWIIGLDAFQTLPRWYRGNELAQMCEWLIAPRQITDENTIADSESVCKQVEKKFKEQSYTIKWQLLDTPLTPISSSQIRKFCRLGLSIDNLVPESVKIYIATNNLYCKNSE